MNQDKDQGPAVRGEAVAEERWCLGCNKAGHRSDECWSTQGLNTPQDRELMRLCHIAVSARAADAPSESSELLTMAQVDAIRETIKPGDGWDGDNWDFALANAVAAKVKSRAAEALDSQPTYTVSGKVMSQLEYIEYMHRQYAGERLRGDQGWERYESANKDRNALRASLAATQPTVAAQQGSIADDALVVAVTAHCNDLTDCASTLREHGDFDATAAEILKAVAELRAARDSRASSAPVAPIAPDAVRNDALEEAAKACDFAAGMAKDEIDDATNSDSFRSDYIERKAQAEQDAATIRGLKSTQQEGSEAGNG
jgi:hypothetical protein